MFIFYSFNLPMTCFLRRSIRKTSEINWVTSLKPFPSRFLRKLQLIDFFPFKFLQPLARLPYTYREKKKKIVPHQKVPVCVRLTVRVLLLWRGEDTQAASSRPVSCKSLHCILFQGLRPKSRQHPFPSIRAVPHSLSPPMNRQRLKARPQNLLSVRLARLFIRGVG